MSSPTAHDSRSSMLTNAAPAISLGAAWAVRKTAAKVYEARTGQPAPMVSRQDASIAKRLMWAAAMAASVALIEIIIWRVLDPND